MIEKIRKLKPRTIIITAAVIVAVLMAGILGNYGTGSDIDNTVRDFFTIGTRTAYAAGTPDYTCDGVADDVEIQAALNALPADGGRLCILAGTYHFTATVSRAIDDVIIEGVGAGVVLDNNGATALFTAGAQDGWSFRDLETDAGGITTTTATNCIFANVTIGADYYAYWLSPDIVADEYDAPVGRSATYYVAASDAPDYEQAQADIVCDGTADDVQIQYGLDNYESVHLSRGTFNIATTVTVSSGEGLMGEGTDPAGTVLKAITNLNDYVVEVTDAATYAEQPYMSDLRIDGNKANQSGTPNAVSIDSHQGIYRNITVVNAKGHGVYIQLNFASEDNWYYCLRVFSSGYNGVFNNNGGGQRFYGLQSHDNGYYGLDMSASTTANTFYNAFFYQNGGTTYSGAHINGYGNQFYGLYVRYSGKWGAEISGDYNTIYGGNAEANARNGITLLSGGDYNRVIGMDILDNGTGGTQPYGVNLNSNYNEIASCVIYDSGSGDQDYGIYDTGGTYNIIHDCTFYDNVIAAVYFNSGTNEYHDNNGYIAPGEIRTIQKAITAGVQNTVTSIQNTFGANVFILEAYVTITVAASATNPTYDLGTDSDGAGAPSDGNNLFDAIPDTAGYYRSTSNGLGGAASGVQIQPVSWTSGSTHDYVNFIISDAAGADTAGRIFLQVMGKG